MARVHRRLIHDTREEKATVTSPTTALTVAIAFGAMLLNGAPGAAEPEQAARPSCSVPSASAAVIRMVPADTPAIAKLLGLTGIAMVQITLSNSGTLERARIAKSSGSKWLDAAAIDAVHEQGYSPEINECQAVSGTYLVSVDFNDANSNS